MSFHNKSRFSVDAWRSAIKSARTADYRQLTRKLNIYLKNKDNKSLQSFTSALEKSQAIVQKLAENTPVVSYPEELPISQRRDEIKELIKNHQVVIVAGETGSGKTTQLPKICLDFGLGRRGLIGHTQPRRIAARTVASRIADELGGKLGETVGYQVRFTKSTSEISQIKLMTDGVLLSEIQNDRLLSQYEVIIIDEAHERSLNIDFLLGLLKTLCKKRPDLKIIITSATIDPEKFAQHFAQDSTPAPIIEVSGRTFPVELEYRPKLDTDLALEDEITACVKYIIEQEQQGHFKAKGDILVFCSGERDIRMSMESLAKARLNIDLLPLYSRLSIAEQNKVFQPSARRKVVLATNVAETSLTVPGIAYVIDPGLARISRYSYKSKVQRLPIEAISQASAKQRMGRCGRVANGVCIRLYSEEDFLARSEFTPAEILRSNLASVILKMRSLGIRDIHSFAFIDMPDTRLLTDGIKLLQELKAIDGAENITTIGKQLSRLPIDPKYARILVEANAQNCLTDALVVISALSIQDPRERPADMRQKADEAHKRLLHPQSDFISYLYLWQTIINQRQELSNSQFKQYCKSNFLSIARIFEWRELFQQLRTICKELKWNVSNWQSIELPELKNSTQKKHIRSEFDGRYLDLHKALLSGLLGNIAQKSLEKHYQATRNRKVFIFPGSGLVKRSTKNPIKWVMSAELMETSNTFMLTVAEILPEWIVDAALHLCKYSYSEPYYSSRSGKVMAKRKTLLGGLILREQEPVDYAKVNPSVSREIFIQRGLVDGQYSYRPKKVATRSQTFSQHNRKIINKIVLQENKIRTSSLLINDQEQFALYAKKIPNDVVDRNSFEKWYRKASKVDTALLFFTEEELLDSTSSSEHLAKFPDHLKIQGKRFKLHYTFDPQAKDDGVSLLIPQQLLGHIPENLGSWLVPGLLEEKCIALLKTLPKPLRKQLVPITNTVKKLLPKLIQGNESLQSELCHQVLRETGVKITPSDLDMSKLDAYYRMNYRVLKDNGQVLSEGRDLETLRAKGVDYVQSSIKTQQHSLISEFERHTITQWDFGELPEAISYTNQGMQVTAYPALQIQKNGSLSRVLIHDKNLARYFSKKGLIALTKSQNVHGNQKQSYRYLQKELFKVSKQTAKNNKNKNTSLADQLSGLNTAKIDTDTSVWIEPVINAGLWQCCFASLKDIPRNQEQYEQALQNSRQWVSTAMEIEKALDKTLEEKLKIRKMLTAIKSNNNRVTKLKQDIDQQLERLFAPDMLEYTPKSVLKDYLRYLKAIHHRIDKLDTNIDTSSLKQVTEIQNKFDQACERELKSINQRLDKAYQIKCAALYTMQPQWHAFAMLLEEWRVSIFAQQLKTRVPVSYKRVLKAAEAIFL